MAGVVIALIPGLTSATGAFGGSRVVYELLYVVMAVPRASNKVWKEALLSKRRHRSQRAAVPELAFLEVAFEVRVIASRSRRPRQRPHANPCSPCLTYCRVLRLHPDSHDIGCCDGVPSHCAVRSGVRV